MSEKQISIFIADDYQLIREGIKRVVKKIPHAVIAGESSVLADLPARALESQPDIIIMELTLCDGPLKQVLEEIKYVSPRTRVLIVSDCICEIPVLASVKAGISGFIRKNVTETELITAIKTIASGEEYFTKEISALVVKSYSNPGQNIEFSSREIEVLKYICKGRSNEQIAEILFISEKTAATHRKNIMRKAAVKKTSELIIWALQGKIV